MRWPACGVRLSKCRACAHLNAFLRRRGGHSLGCVRADNVTGMLGVDLGSQSVVAKVNAVTDLAGKDVSARRVTTLLSCCGKRCCSRAWQFHSRSVSPSLRLSGCAPAMCVRIRQQSTGVLDLRYLSATQVTYTGPSSW